MCFLYLCLAESGEEERERERGLRRFFASRQAASYARMCFLYLRFAESQEDEEDSLSMGPLSENEIEDDEDDPIISIYSYEDEEGEEEGEDDGNSESTPHKRYFECGVDNLILFAFLASQRH